MSVRHWFALLICIPIAAICLCLPFVPQTILPVGTIPLDRQHYVVDTSSYAVPLPTGLRAGDVVDATRMDTSSRLGLTTYALVPAGTRVMLAVNRHGRELQVPVAFVRMPITPTNMLEVVLEERGQVHLQAFELSRGRLCAVRTPAKRWVLASTIARKSSRPSARCC